MLNKVSSSIKSTALALAASAALGVFASSAAQAQEQVVNL